VSILLCLSSFLLCQVSHRWDVVATFDEARNRKRNAGNNAGSAGIHTATNTNFARRQLGKRISQRRRGHALRFESFVVEPERWTNTGKRSWQRHKTWRSSFSHAGFHSLYSAEVFAAGLSYQRFLTFGGFRCTSRLLLCSADNLYHFICISYYGVSHVKLHIVLIFMIFFDIFVFGKCFS